MQDQHVLDDKTGYVFIWRMCCQIALVSDHSVRTIVSLFMQSGRKLKEDGAERTRRASRKLAGVSVSGPFSMCKLASLLTFDLDPTRTIETAHPSSI